MKVHKLFLDYFPKCRYISIFTELFLYYEYFHKLSSKPYENAFFLFIKLARQNNRANSMA